MFSEREIVIALTVAFIFLQLVDWYATRTILKAGGIETNELTKAILKVVNVDVYLAGKTALAAVVGYNLGFVLMPMLVALVVMYGFFMWRNLRNL